VGDGARLGAQAGVIGDVPAGATFWGTPARPRTETLRRLANMGKVQELARRIKVLEEAGNAGRDTE
jgi:UDP-3-O-[3-hydroxymyristoyl] glucosamine N-acyltransferase